MLRYFAPFSNSLKYFFQLITVLLIFSFYKFIIKLYVCCENDRNYFDLDSTLAYIINILKIIIKKIPPLKVENFTR